MPHTKDFLKLSKAIKKQYLGKPVPIKLRKKYGIMVYGPKDVKKITFAIAKVAKIKID